MDFVNSPFYKALLVVGVAIVGVLSYFIWRNWTKLLHHKKKAETAISYDSETPTGIQFEKVKVKEQTKEQTEEITKEGVINARIYDVQHRTRYLRHVKLIKDKDYGRQWLCGKDYVFALQKNGDKLTPIIPPKSMEHPPSELYEALQTKDDVAEVMGNRDESGDKIKLGLLILLAGVVVFLMFIYLWKGKGGG